MRVDNAFHGYCYLRLQCSGIEKAELRSHGSTASSTGLTLSKYFSNFKWFRYVSVLRGNRIQLSFFILPEKKRNSPFTLITHCNLIEEAFLSKFFGFFFWVSKPNPRIMHRDSFARAEAQLY